MFLTDSNGYKYTRKIDNNRPHLYDYRCCKRARPISSRAFVKFKNGEYIRTPIGNPHQHAYIKLFPPTWSAILYSY